MVRGGEDTPTCRSDQKAAKIASSDAEGRSLLGCLEMTEDAPPHERGVYETGVQDLLQEWWIFHGRKGPNPTAGKALRDPICGWRVPDRTKKDAKEQGKLDFLRSKRGEKRGGTRTFREERGLEWNV